MGRPKTINVAVVGDASAGKSALIHALTGSVAKEEPSKPNGRYWAFQKPADNGKVAHDADGVSYQIVFSEVVGARGRMSNYHNMSLAIKKANVILFCAAHTNDLYSFGLSRVLNTIQREKNKKASLIVVRTLVDQERSQVMVDNPEIVKGFVNINVSTVSGQGIDEIIPAVFQNYKSGVPAIEVYEEQKKLAKAQAQEKDQSAQIKEDAKLATALSASQQDGSPFKKLKIEVDVPPVA